MKKIAVAACVLAFSACASSTDDLQRATAMSVPGNFSPDRVTIANVDRGASSVSWTAQAGGHSYACNSDDMVRRPYCSPR